MELDNSKLPINILLDKINEAAKGNQGITLTDEETKLLSKEVGDLVFIPFLSNEDILNMQAH
jgi:hypothetical protein|nr:hypothetical protein [Moraxella osloensis]